MNEEQAFVRAILDNPDDDTLRLIFADWLEEQGDPQGEFIRIQVELHLRSRAALSPPPARTCRARYSASGRPSSGR
jgi:uncharacterized protein (TIGR02996 family)